MELRVAVFTVQTYDLTPEEAATELQRLGYDGAEWRVTALPKEMPGDPNFWNANICTFEIDDIGNQAARMRELSDTHNLAIPTLGTYLDCTKLDQVEACLAAAKAIDVPMLRVGLPGWRGEASYPAAFEDAQHKWDPVVELARSYGIRVLAELHHGGLTLSGATAARFLSRWDPEHVGAIYDPGNMIHEGWERPELSAGILGPYLAHVHVKNARWMTGQPGAARCVACGRGL
jgi:sugar phosphate isomerase/epimerase